MRSLRMKLVMIMVLLIIALMIVVASFLINGVGSFYLGEFYEQMGTSFSEDFLLRLTDAAADGPENLYELVMAQSDLAIDLGSRNAYILDENGVYLCGSTDESEFGQEITDNILTAMTGQVGQERSIINSYMDVAIPIFNGDNQYIVYIRDNKQTVDNLNSQIIMIIFQSLALGLVICVVLSFLLAEIMINPIERLTEGTMRVAEGDFGERIEVHSRDEISVLTENFNEMAGVLQSTMDEINSERDKLSTLFLHMTDGVVAFSRNGNVIQSNPASARMLRREMDEGVVYDDIFGSISPLEEILEQSGSEPISAQMKVGKSDLELSLAPFSADESQGGVLAVIHDVTAQRKSEEMRREFVANVSHELRTPLTNIKSYTETLIDAGDDLPPDMKASFFGVILSEADRMTRIVQDLLTLSRFDYGKMEMNFTDFGIAEAVQNVYNAVIIDAQNHGHELLLEMEKNLPVIHADKERMEQVIMNIVSNAIKYTPDGGRIEISAWTMGEKVSISVSDNGVGIPEEDQPRLFDRFYRVDKARSREAGGSGLGLSIVKEIVQAHNGDIDIRSKQGEGTTMTVTLPIKR